MTRGLVITGAALWALSVPAAEAPADPVLAALVQWTEMGAAELALEGAPSAERVVGAVADTEVYRARASFGALLFEDARRSRHSGRMDFHTSFG